MVGRYSLAAAVATPLFMFANMQLAVVQATDTGRTYAFSEYRWTRCLTSTLAFLAVAIIGLLVYEGERSLAVAAFGLLRAVESLSDVHYGLFQQRERMDLVARSLILRGPLSLAFLALSIAATRSVVISVASVALASALTLLLFDRVSARSIVACQASPVSSSNPGRAGGRPVWGRLASLVGMALPLGLVMMMVSLETNVPRLIIGNRGGEGLLGVFVVVLSLAVAGGTIMGSLAQAALPRLARFYAAGQHSEFKAGLSQLLGVAGLVGLLGLAVAAVFGREILTLIFTAEYAEHQRLLILLMGAAAIQFVSTALGAGVSAMRCFAVQLWIHVGDVVFLVPACWVLFDRFGLLGAAWGVLAGAVVLCAAYGVVTAARLRAAKTVAPEDRP